MTTQELHKQTVREVADEYRKRGYSVDVEPRGDKVPLFLSGFYPDLIARSPDESVVIEVKVGASKTSVAEPLKALADRVHKQPGWRLAVIFADPDVPGHISEVPVRSSEELEAQIVRSEKLKVAGDLDAAFLLLWSTMEAALRNVATKAGLPLQTSPTSSLMRELYSAGEISRETYESILNLMGLRNRVAHGFAASPTIMDFEKLVGATRTLAAELKGDIEDG